MVKFPMIFMFTRVHCSFVDDFFTVLAKCVRTQHLPKWVSFKVDLRSTSIISSLTACHRNDAKIEKWQFC